MRKSHWNIYIGDFYIPRLPKVCDSSLESLSGCLKALKDSSEIGRLLINIGGVNFLMSANYINFGAIRKNRVKDIQRVGLPTLGRYA